MGYIIASFIAIFITTLIVYKVANNLFGLGLRLKPILLCAVCAMLISLVLPKIIVGFAGLPATLAVLAVFAVVFAYFVARYEDLPQTDTGTDVEADSSCDFGDMLAASTEAATSEQLQNTDGCQSAAEFDSNISSSDVVTGEAEVLVSGQALTSLFETDTTGNNLNKGQLTPEEESLNDTLVSSNNQEVGIGQAEINTADNEIVVEDNSSAFQHTNEQENVDIILAEVENVNEKQEPDTFAESEVVESDLSAEMLTQKEIIGPDHLQSVLADVVEPGGEETVDNILLSENTVLEEEHQSEAASINKSDEVDTQSTAEIIENEVNEQVAAEAVDQNDNENVSADIDLDNKQQDNLDLSTENTTDTAENNFNDNVMNDLAEDSEQVAVEVVEQMPNEELAGQAESPADQVFMQEVDDGSMKYNEVTVNPVQLETEDLDELIDNAFVYKETQDYNNAYKVFKKALALYPNSEAAPFLVVEIGTILKNKGDYDEAIKVFSEGRNLSQTKHDEMMEQEFISTIAYLRITKNILLQNRFGNIPFSEIPTQILNQIDEEFREWRNVGNI